MEEVKYKGTMFDRLRQIANAQRYQRKGPLDYRTWIFSSTDNRCFNYNSKYLFLYVRAHYPRVRARYVINDALLRRKLQEQYGRELFVDGASPEGMRQILAAGVWFTSAGLPAYEMTGRPDRIVVNLWHGIPLKRIVLMGEQSGRFTKLWFRQIFSRKYTYILTTSRELIPIMAQSFGVPESKVKVWGQPRDDAVLKGDRKQELEELFALPEDATCVLYAPTYRDTEATRLFPFADFVPEDLESYLAQNEMHIFIRLHLDEQNKGEEIPRLAHVHMLGEDLLDDITEYLNCFAILVTDYSSIYFDYLLLDRPIIFLPYDQDSYLKQRGLNFDYEKVTPGPKPRTQQELVACLETCRQGQEAYALSRKKVRAFFHQVKTPCSRTICCHIIKRIKLYRGRKEQL